MRTEGLPATVFTEGERGRAASVVEDEGLALMVKIFLNGGQERGREIAIFGEIIAIFEIDESSFGCNGIGFGFLV